MSVKRTAKSYRRETGRCDDPRDAISPPLKIREVSCSPQGCCPEKPGNAQISLCFEDLESEIASMERTVERAMAAFSPVVLCQANGIVATDAPLPPRSPVAERLAEAASRIKYSRAQLEMLVDASDL